MWGGGGKKDSRADQQRARDQQSQREINKRAIDDRTKKHLDANKARKEHFDRENRKAEERQKQLKKEAEARRNRNKGGGGWGGGGGGGGGLFGGGGGKGSDRGWL